MGKFVFDLGQKVMLSMSQERGRVIGRAEYEHSQNTYCVRYLTTNGRQIEDWIAEDALEEAVDVLTIRPANAIPAST